MGTHHQTEALEVAKGGGDHARDTCDGFKKENSLVVREGQDEMARI